MNDVSFLYQLKKQGTFPPLARQYEGKSIIFFYELNIFHFCFHVSFTIKGCKLRPTSVALLIVINVIICRC